MTKIYEALEQASEDRSGSGVPMPSPSKLPRGLEEKLLSLYQRIETLVEDKPSRIVEFVGVQTGEDSSILTCEFAKLVAARLGKRVLLLATTPCRYIRQVFRGTDVRGWEDVVEGDVAIDEVIRPLEDTSVSVGLMAASSSMLPSIVASPNLAATIEHLRERFDLILIDSPNTPPLGVSPEAALLSSVSDGVVLVLEAGKTRWQVAKFAGISSITSHQGRILGVILNKHRFIIPNFIYQKL